MPISFHSISNFHLSFCHLPIGCSCQFCHPPIGPLLSKIQIEFKATNVDLSVQGPTSKEKMEEGPFCKNRNLFQLDLRLVFSTPPGLRNSDFSELESFGKFTQRPTILVTTVFPDSASNDLKTGSEVETKF